MKESYPITRKLQSAYDITLGLGLVSLIEFSGITNLASFLTYQASRKLTIFTKYPFLRMIKFIAIFY